MLADILLGKSALFKIPWFKTNSFPDASFVTPKVVAFGLVLMNIKRIAGILLAGIILPLNMHLEGGLFAIKVRPELAILRVLDFILIQTSAWYYYSK